VKDILKSSPLALIAIVAIAVLGMTIHAQASDANIKSLTIDKWADGEALVFSIEGYATPKVEILPDLGAIAVTFNGAEVASDFLIPALDNAIEVEKVNYKLGLGENTRQVSFTFFLRDVSKLNENSYRIEEKDGQTAIVILNKPALTEPMDLLAPQEKPSTTPQEPSYLTEIKSIDISPTDGGEKVILKLASPAIPIIKKLNFPTRVLLEIEGGYLSDEMIDKFMYDDKNGLIKKVDLFVSTIDESGVLRVIITAPDMAYYEVKSPDDVTHELCIYGTTMIAETPAENTPPPEAAVVEIPPVVEQPAIAEVTTPETPSNEETVTPEKPAKTTEVSGSVEQPSTEKEEEVAYKDIPPVKEEAKDESNKTEEKEASGESIGYSLGYGDVEPMGEGETPAPRPDTSSDELQYPDLPVDEEAAQWEFPEMQKAFDPRHISDAIVSLNFVNAEFIDVMMILAQQAGVNFILDAYWNIPPTGHSRERPVGGPGGTGFGMGGFQPGGGWNPPIQGTGSVTLFIQEVPFDEAFNLLMKANNLDYKVFRATPDAEPLLFLSTRERLEGELGLGVIKSYQLHYIPPQAALDFLYRMDMLPSSSGFGFWYYGGGGGTGGWGGGGQGGGGGGQGGGGGGGWGGGGGGGGYGNMPAPETPNPNSIPQPQVPDFSKPTNLTGQSQFEAFGQPTFYGPNYSPMQWGGGGGGFGGGGQGGGGQGGGGGGQGGGGGGGGQQGGQPYTARGGVIAIMATEEMHSQVSQALSQVDKPPKQVYIEAIFINTDKNPIQTAKVFGVENFGQWAFEGGGDRFFAQFDVTGTEGLVFSILPKNQSVPFEDFRMRLQYLFDDRYARIVTAPRVAVIDGYTATIGVFENRPFIINGGIIIDQFGNAIPAPSQVTFVPTGTFLTITPFVDDYGNITMNLSPSQQQLLGEPQLINGNLIFGTVNTQIATTLRLRDGETIILGGLTTRNRDVNKKYLPLLGDIPLIGQLFGRKTVIETESQLVVLITVHLVGN